MRKKFLKKERRKDKEKESQLLFENFEQTKMFATDTDTDTVLQLSMEVSCNEWERREK